MTDETKKEELNELTATEATKLLDGGLSEFYEECDKNGQAYSDELGLKDAPKELTIEEKIDLLAHAVYDIASYLENHVIDRNSLTHIMQFKDMKKLIAKKVMKKPELRNPND